ncbi:MAG: putative hydrolase [Pseudobdellovibrio sp.]|jgi:HAD superfamily hydrolase (TIGR01484 family)|nr:putative hydrolase [Pseudobdellovibrio sp.]
MKNLSDFHSKIEFVLTDIDDTLTTDGQLESQAYSALWRLHDAGLKVIPITGRPAGWCEMIARMWPVAGVVGENGGFYFRYAALVGDSVIGKKSAASGNPDSNSPNEKIKKMQRWFFADEKFIKENKLKLSVIENEVLSSVKGTALASDQFCRLMDLAIDFCEDVPALPDSEVTRIVQIFEKHGAHAKVSSIHVNGWFGDYDKLSTSYRFLKTEFGLTESDILAKCAFVGDSPNDEPMFSRFPHSFGVANVKKFSSRMKSLPTYVSESEGGDGFSEIADRILHLKD